MFSGYCWKVNTLPSACGDVQILATVYLTRVFSEGAPRDVSFGAVRELLLSVGGVTAIHSLHMWSLNTTHSLLSVHLATGKRQKTVLLLMWRGSRTCYKIP